MPVRDPVSQADQIQSLLNDLIQDVSDVPAERKQRVEAAVQKIRAGINALTHDVGGSSLSLPPAAQQKQPTGEVRYQELINLITDPVVIYDANLRLIYRNTATREATQIPDEQALGKTFSELYPDLVGSEVHQVYLRVLETRQPQRYENRWLRPSDGQEFYFDFSAYPTQTGFVVFSKDVTERMRAARAQKEANQRALWMSRFPDENPSPVARVSFDGKVLYCNRVAADPSGWAFGTGEYITEPFLSVLGETTAQAKQIQRDIQIGQRSYIITFMPFPNDQYVNLYGLDITERKRAEEALRQSEYLLEASERKTRELIQYAPTGIYEIDFRTGKFLSVNDAMAELSGYSREELLQMRGIDLLVEEDRVRFEERVREWLSGGKPDETVEYRIRAKDGHIIYAILNTTFTKDEQGRPLGATVIGHDITERKRSETFTKALLEINQAIHSTLNSSEVLSRSIAIAGKALGCDTAGLSLRKEDHWLVSGIYGMPEEMLGMEMDDNQERHAMLAIQTRQPVPVNDAFNDERFNREHLRKYGIRSVLVIPVIVKDEAIGVVFFNYQKSTFHFQPVHIDFARQVASSLSAALENAQLYQNLEKEIAERRKIEARERARANELEALMDAAPAVIWISRDRECREMIGNRYSYDILRIQQGENVSKTAPEEAVGIQRYHMEIDGCPVPACELPMQIAAATGKPAKDYAFDLVYQDGTVFHMFGNVNPILDQDGEPCGAIGVFVDLTNLRRLEEEQIQAKTAIEVQRRLMDQREQERQAIARDLHDGPIQTLSSTIFHLQMVKEVFPEPALQVELNQIGTDIKSSIHEIREVLNDLRPPALMHFGFTRMIQMYTEDLLERFPAIEIELDVMDDKGITSDTVRLALFRIYQAAINNIVRHSGASKTWVSFMIEQGTFQLEIQDNGAGFDLTQDFTQLTRSGHFGIVGMKERAEAIGGAFAISSEPGHGTTIVVKGPL